MDGAPPSVYKSENKERKYKFRSCFLFLLQFAWQYMRLPREQDGQQKGRSLAVFSADFWPGWAAFDNAYLGFHL